VLSQLRAKHFIRCVITIAYRERLSKNRIKRTRCAVNARYTILEVIHHIWAVYVSDVPFSPDIKPW